MLAWRRERVEGAGNDENVAFGRRASSACWRRARRRTRRRRDRRAGAAASAERERRPEERLPRDAGSGSQGGAGRARLARPLQRRRRRRLRQAHAQLHHRLPESVAATADGRRFRAAIGGVEGGGARRRARRSGFELVDERRSGVRIGAPLKILDKIAMIGGDVDAREGGRRASALAIAGRAGEPRPISRPSTPS